MIMLVQIRNNRFTVNTANWIATPVPESEDDYAALRNHCVAPHKVRLDDDMIRTVKRITKNRNVPVSYMRDIYGAMPYDHEFNNHLCHATGYEFSMSDDKGEWCNEYYDDTVDRYYYALKEGNVIEKQNN